MAGTAAAMALIGSELSTNAAARMDRFGTTMANMAAELGRPHVVQQKQLELENLAKRIVEFDGVRSCSFYTVDGRTLAFAGNDAATRETKHYPAGVTIGDSLAGFARVVLNADDFKPDALALLASAWPIWFGALASALAFVLHGRARAAHAAEPEEAATSRPPEPAAGPSAAPAGEPQRPAEPAKPADAPTEYAAKAKAPAPNKPPSAASPTAPRLAPDAPRSPAPHHAPSEHATPDEGPDLAVVVNLFNAASLSAAAKSRALTEALGLGRRVAKAHRGAAKAVPGAGVLLRFQALRGEDAALAGLELARGIAAADLDGAEFRCALHRGRLTGPAADTAITDALLLTALAPPRLLAASEAALRCIGLERVRTTTIPERSVAALAAATLRRCHVLHDVRAE